MTAFRICESTDEYSLTRSVTGGEIIDQAREILHGMLRRPDSKSFTDPSAVRAFLQISLATKQREVFACLFLDNRHRLIRYEEMFQGTIDGASVHPRIVVQKALQYNAAAVILAHFVPRNKMVLMSRNRLCGVFRQRFDLAKIGIVLRHITSQLP